MGYNFLCFGDIGIVGYAENKVYPALALGIIVDYVAAGYMRIRHYNSFVINGYKLGIHHFNLVHLAADRAEVDIITALERVVDEYLNTAGELADARLQAEAGGDAGGAYGGYERIDVHIHRRKCRQNDRKFKQQHDDGLDKSVYRRVYPPRPHALDHQLAHEV